MMKNEDENKMHKKMVLVSHSSKDIGYVASFVELMEGIVEGLQKENLICTTMDEYGIPVGDNIYDYLRSSINNTDLYLVYILSPNYYRSPACLNEMGAGWILSLKQDVLVVPEFSIESINGAVDKRMVVVPMENRTRILEVIGKIASHLDLQVKLNLFERKYEDYYNKIQACKNEMRERKRPHISIKVKGKNGEYTFVIRVKNNMNIPRKCEQFIIWASRKGKRKTIVLPKDVMENMVVWGESKQKFQHEFIDRKYKWDKIKEIHCESRWNDEI